MLTQKFRKMIAVMISFSLLFLGVASSSASAGMISTGDVIAEQSLSHDKDSLRAMLDSDEVMEKLLELGVDRDDVLERVDAMTPAELAQLNQQIDELPAGSGVVGLLLTLFIVFVITDVIGATDIFPFIHPVR